MYWFVIYVEEPMIKIWNFDGSDKKTGPTV
jgi:hypothetical protein